MPPSPFLTALKELATYLGKKLDLISSKLDNSADTSVSDAIKDQTRTLSILNAKIASALEDLRKIEVQSDVNIDTSKLERSLSDVLAMCGTMKIPSTGNIEASLKMIRDSIIAGNAANAEGLALVQKSIASLSLAVPSTFMLDQNQLRSITGSLRSMPTNPGVLAARGVRTVNVALAASTAEYSYTFPANTTAWNLKLRDQGTLSYYAFVSGKMPSGGDGSNYVTIPQNFVQSPENVDWSGKTIYLGAESDGQVAELTVFTA